MKLAARLLREPLFHFLAAGGAVFLLYRVLTGPAPEPIDAIVIGPQRIEQLQSGFEAVWRRPPSTDELKGMIASFIREEVYYREALALGLDRDDTVIRQRLRQKMEFLTQSGADLLEPGAGELEAYFAANQKAYLKEPAIAFEQVYLGENPAPETVARVLATLRTDAAVDAASLGQTTLLPARLDLSPPGEVDAVFGKDFFARLEALPKGQWSGPVASGYGAHLIRILDTSPATTPPLAEVRAAVVRDWKAARATKIREQSYGRLRRRYTVEFRGVDAALQVSQ